MPGQLKIKKLLVMSCKFFILNIKKRLKICTSLSFLPFKLFLQISFILYIPQDLQLSLVHVLFFIATTTGPDRLTFVSVKRHSLLFIIQVNLVIFTKEF